MYGFPYGDEDYSETGYWDDYGIYHSYEDEEEEEEEEDQTDSQDWEDMRGLGD